MLNLSQELACSLDSSLPSDVRSTMRQLASRHHELGQRQSLTSVGISQVEREIDALEQLKVSIESQLEERQTYALFIAECVQFKEDFEQFVQDDVYVELKKEQQLTNEMISALQNHIRLLLSQTNGLQVVYSQLQLDYKDKGEAIKLTAKCITHDNSQQNQQKQLSKWHVGYNEWLSDCKKLQNTANTLLDKSAALRGNVKLTMASLKNVFERQRSNTNKAMRKRIHDMKKTEEQMHWYKQKALDEIEELKKSSQKVATEMINCKSRKFQNSNKLDTLNRRQRFELCLDEAHNSLMLQKCDLDLITSELERMLRRGHGNIEDVRRRLPAIDEKIKAQGRALQMEQKCQDMYHSILPLHRTSVGPDDDNNNNGLNLTIDQHYS